MNGILERNYLNEGCPAVTVCTNGFVLSLRKQKQANLASNLHCPWKAKLYGLEDQIILF